MLSTIEREYKFDPEVGEKAVRIEISGSE